MGARPGGRRRTELVTWRQGRCLPYGEGITFWALGEIVKAEAGILGSDNPSEAHGKLELAVAEVVADEPEHGWFTDRLAPLVGAQEESAGRCSTGSVHSVAALPRGACGPTGPSCS